MKTPWVIAAEKMVSDACLIAYQDAQKSSKGKTYKEHKPYSVPDWCKDLLKVIQTEDEYKIKAAMYAVRSGCYSLIGE